MSTEFADALLQELKDRQLTSPAATFIDPPSPEAHYRIVRFHFAINLLPVALTGVRLASHILRAPNLYYAPNGGDTFSRLLGREVVDAQGKLLKATVRLDQLRQELSKGTHKGLRLQSLKLQIKALSDRRIRYAALAQGRLYLQEAVDLFDLSKRTSADACAGKLLGEAVFLLWSSVCHVSQSNGGAKRHAELTLKELRCLVQFTEAHLYNPFSSIVGIDAAAA